jgi:hypothetical protein
VRSAFLQAISHAAALSVEPEIAAGFPEGHDKAAAGFVMNGKQLPYGVDEIVSITKESQISIWKVSLTKGVAMGDTVEVVSYNGTAQDIFRNTWTIIGFRPPVIMLQKTAAGANQTLVINARAATFVYSTTGDLIDSLPSSSIFWGTCEN